MITIEQYWMGRDKDYPGDLTEAILQAAVVTVSRVSELLGRAAAAGVTLDINPRTGTLVASGWRPPEVNGSTPGAAVKSKHLTGHALDVYDPDGDLDEWCLEHPHELQALGLYQEHPGATKGWCHLQILPPKSGKRVFYP